ncbi:pyrroloquinoline quinone-dependent dehydrogenase [Parahaliea aestuarii]|uniref:Pyrroloquinoline quinone-dependent dehydrogenase n=2 Tax=Parahaliea aestuarii TaxID=1852021 RepID=A0A5C8ZTL9_9GAMM|nr:pyrroloquinoline quinone-dependent dehydrogenase [Parahaliea aestuarii]
MERMMQTLAVTVAPLLIAAMSLSFDALGAGVDEGSWPHYGGDEGGQRYSPLSDISTGNVAELEIAWEYHTGDLVDGAGLASMKLPAFEATPLEIEGLLYACTPRNHVVALEAETGRERWVYRHQPVETGHYVMTCRGVSYHRSQTDPEGMACKSRILMGTVDAYLVALDAKTGERCEKFGQNGKVDLREGLGSVTPGHYKVMSPPAIINNVAVVGALVEDNQTLDSPPGVIRAFDVATGELRWAWDPVPPGWKKQPGSSRWQRGTPNAWSVFSIDTENNLVFVPTGNAAPDFYSGARNGLDYHASSLVALDARTGEVRWHFQTVHHDIWDYDVPAQPVLFDYPGKDGPIPAVAQATKQGFIFILNRITGEPLFPVEEKAFPSSSIAGMVLSDTQPVPSKPDPLLNASLSEDDIWGFTPWDRGKCLDEYRRHRSEGLFTPPSEQGTILYPAHTGASNWGSVAIDPGRGLLLANYTRVASIVTLIPRRRADQMIASGKGPVYPIPDSSYAFDLRLFLSPLGAPCTAPPWGGLRAIDLASGDTVWDRPLGTTRDVAPFPLWLELGVPNQGGALVTGGGLTFIGATTDNFIRAFDTETGDEVWKHRLPAGGQATPMTYRGAEDGRQYVVISAGGHAYLGTDLGDSIVAFRLPASVHQSSP